MTTPLVTPSAKTFPWQDRPAGCSDILWRWDENPVIDRNPIPGVSRIFNSAVVPRGDGYIGVFRVESREVRPQLHCGHSRDALHWQIEDQPIQWLNEAGEPVKNGFAYDPRLVEIEGTHYITWCDDFPGASIGMGKTTDFKTFIKMENPTMPFNRNGVLFPRKVNGEYLLLSRPSDSGHTPFGDIILSHSRDMTYWGKHRLLMTTIGKNWWENLKIGAGPIPIETREGWLLIYHGVTGTCNGFVYSIGGALLDLEDPTRVIARSKDFLLTPEKDYETVGFVPNVTFPCAALHDESSGRIAIYYGGADTVTALAFAHRDELVDYIKSRS